LHTIEFFKEFMLQTIINTFVTAVSLVSLTTAPAEFPATPIQVNQERVHAVKSGESLSLLAQAYYHNPDAWVSILKDNPTVTHPDRIEAGTLLKIRYIPLAVDASESAALQPVEQPVHDSIVLEASQAAIQTATPSTVPTAPQNAYIGGPLSEEQLTFLGNCEAGMNPTRNTGNGYYGAFQFSYGTWQRMETGYERADLAPLEIQKAAVQKLLSRSSIFTQFPGCARKMQAEGLL
jgi:hypothetical protein